MLPDKPKTQSGDATFPACVSPTSGPTVSLMVIDVLALVGESNGPRQPWAVGLIIVVSLGIVVVWVRRFMGRK